jgi:hypothetical protein
VKEKAIHDGYSRLAEPSVIRQLMIGDWAESMVDEVVELESGESKVKKIREGAGAVPH